MYHKCIINSKHILDLVHVLLCVLVGHVGGADVQLEIRAEVLKVVVVRQLWNRNIIGKSKHAASAKMNAAVKGFIRRC